MPSSRERVGHLPNRGEHRDGDDRLAMFVLDLHSDIGAVALRQAVMADCGGSLLGLGLGGVEAVEFKAVIVAGEVVPTDTSK